MIRALILDEKARARIAAVVACAEQNHYHPGGPIPGDDPKYVAQLNDYRCVFSITYDTCDDSVLWRHLSISVPSEKYPHQAAAFMIAREFGFTGWDGVTLAKPPTGWLMDINTRDHCVVLLQQLRNGQ